MVALANKSPILSPTPLRVRAQNHRYRLGAAFCSKSSIRANLRGATYDESKQLGSCSKDPIGFEGSPWNLYEILSGSPLVDTDSSGLISAKRRSGTDVDRKGWGACSPGYGDLYMEYEFDYETSPQNSHTYSTVLIRKVTVECLFSKCPCADQPKPDPEKNSYYFYEAIFLPRMKIDRNPKALPTDTVKAPPKIGRGFCGGYYQTGVTKLFRLESIRNLLGGKKSDWEPRQSFPKDATLEYQQFEYCRTQGGPLTLPELPWFDGMDGINPPTHTRHQTQDWCCCDSDEDFFKTTSNP
jgi:hypothetical protein